MHRHPLAWLTPMRRDRLICRHLDAGVPLKVLAVAAGISLQIVSKRLSRYRSGGVSALAMYTPPHRQNPHGSSLERRTRDERPRAGQVEQPRSQSSWAALPVVAPRRHDPWRHETAGPPRACRPSEEPTAGDPRVWGPTTARGAQWPSVTSALIGRAIGCGSLHDLMRKYIIRSPLSGSVQRAGRIPWGFYFCLRLRSRGRASP